MTALRRGFGNRSLWIAAFIAIVIAVIILGLIWEREPTYEVRTLSWWLDVLPETVPTIDGRAMYLGTVTTLGQEGPEESELRRDYFIAIEKIGTNGLPFLLDRLRTKDTFFRRSAQSWIDKLVKRKRPSPPSSAIAVRRRYQALTAIHALGQKAKPMVPNLIRLTRDKDLNVSLAALQALRFVDEDQYRRAKVYSAFASF